jgi:hypothetical protein
MTAKNKNKDPNKIRIIVHADRVGGGPINYSLEQHENDTLKRLQNGRLKARHGDYLDITFTLKDNQTGRGLKISDDPDGPFWIQMIQPGQDEATACPTAPVVDENFDNPPPERVNDKIVRVVNRNGLEADYAYTIRIVDKYGSPEDCDPVIENGGGGPGN